MGIPEIFKKGFDYLKDLIKRNPESLVIIGPFNASIHLAGDTQRGVLIPKEFHDKPWFKKLLNRKKNKITIIVEEFDD